MDSNLILKEFEDAEAILKGHFILSSGLHSDTYIQCARILMNPQRAERICNLLAKKIKNELPHLEFDLVFSPAMGGVIVGYEMGRQLGLPSLFCERVDGEFQLRRGFKIEKGARILIVEDVVTTGKSSKEAFACAIKNGGEIVAEACLIDRTSSPINLGVPLVSLLKINVQTFTNETIPQELKSIEAVKPGSRYIKN